MESPREEDRLALLCAGGWGTVTNPRGICPGGGNATGRIDQYIKSVDCCLVIKTDHILEK